MYSMEIQDFNHWIQNLVSYMYTIHVILYTWNVGKPIESLVLINTKSQWGILQTDILYICLYCRELYHEQSYFRPKISCTKYIEQLFCIRTVIVVEEWNIWMNVVTKFFYLMEVMYSWPEHIPCWSIVM